MNAIATPRADRERIGVFTIKRLLLISMILLLAACSNNFEGVQIQQNESNNSVETIQSPTPSPTPVKEDPELLLSYATRYYEDNNLTEVNIVLSKLKSSTPEATEQIAAVQQMSDELKEIKEKEEAEREQQRLAEIDAKLAKMNVKEDEVTGVTWYRDKSSTEYVDENSFHLYFGKKEDTGPSLRLRIQYEDEDWLFIDKYIIKTDNETFTIYADFGDVNRDNDGGRVWEWLDILVSSDDYKMIESIIASEKTIIRHEGNQYYDDRTLTKKEKDSLKNVIEAYEALGGHLSL